MDARSSPSRSGRQMLTTHRWWPNRIANGPRQRTGYRVMFIHTSNTGRVGGLSDGRVVDSGNCVLLAAACTWLLPEAGCRGETLCRSTGHLDRRISDLDVRCPDQRSSEMTAHGWLQIGSTLPRCLWSIPPLGRFMTHVFNGARAGPGATTRRTRITGSAASTTQNGAFRRGSHTGRQDPRQTSCQADRHDQKRARLVGQPASGHVIHTVPSSPVELLILHELDRQVVGVE